MFADGLLAASPVVDKEQQSAGGMPDAGVSARGGPAAPADADTGGGAAPGTVALYGLKVQDETCRVTCANQSIHVIGFL